MRGNEWAVKRKYNREETQKIKLKTKIFLSIMNNAIEQNNDF